MIQCPTCGSNVSDNADLCPDCGMDLDPASSSPPPAPTPPTPAPSPVELSKDAADFGFDFGFANSTPPQPPLPRASFDEPGHTVVLDTTPTPPIPPAPAAPDSAPAQASLTLKRGGTLTSEKFVVGPSASIGRFDPESGPVDVDMASLPEAVYVSRHHAELRRDAGGQWFIKDLGSRNGTFVRSGGASFARVVGEQALSDGDELSLGNARFEFRVAS